MAAGKLRERRQEEAASAAAAALEGQLEEVRRRQEEAEAAAAGLERALRAERDRVLGLERDLQVRPYIYSPYLAPFRAPLWPPI